MASWLPVDLTMSTEVVCQRWHWREQEVTLAWTSVFLGQIFWNAATRRFQWTALENPKAAAWGSPITTITIATHLHPNSSMSCLLSTNCIWPLNNTGLNCSGLLIHGFFFFNSQYIKYYTVCGWLNPWIWNCSYGETVYTGQAVLRFSTAERISFPALIWFKGQLYRQGIPDSLHALP